MSKYKLLSCRDFPAFAGLTGRPNTEFKAPDGITWAEVDRDTGKLALPGCPRTITESFASGTEPAEYCELHRF